MVQNIWTFFYNFTPLYFSIQWICICWFNPTFSSCITYSQYSSNYGNEANGLYWLTSDDLQLGVVNNKSGDLRYTIVMSVWVATLAAGRWWYFRQRWQSIYYMNDWTVCYIAAMLVLVAEKVVWRQPSRFLCVYCKNKFYSVQRLECVHVSAFKIPYTTAV